MEYIKLTNHVYTFNNKYNVDNVNYRAFLQQNAEKLIAESFQQNNKPCALCPVCKESVEYKP